MVQVIFRDFKRSDLVKEAVLERIRAVAERFPALQRSSVAVRLTAENTPRKPGADLFSVRIFCETGRYRGLLLEKSSPNLYVALGEATDLLADRLNHFTDRARVKARKHARDFAQATKGAPLRAA